MNNSIFPWLVSSFAVIIVGISLAYIVWARRELRKIERMFERARLGTVFEPLDESRASKLAQECKNFLKSNETLRTELAKEKETLSAFTSEISHQTKTPLSNILLYTELLAEEPLSTKAKSLVSQIQIQSEKLIFLTNALSDISRLESGIIALQQESVDISRWVSQTIEENAGLLSSHRISVVDTTQGQQQGFIDRKWTKEALVNLLENAVKYSPGGSEISLTIHSTSLFVSIAVKDRGLGVAREEQNQIFHRFYRSPQVRHEDGLGLGLYLARKIVELQQGYLYLVSSPGEGSTFSMFLPKA